MQKGQSRLWQACSLLRLPETTCCLHWTVQICCTTSVSAHVHSGQPLSFL